MSCSFSNCECLHTVMWQMLVNLSPVWDFTLIKGYISESLNFRELYFDLRLQRRQHWVTLVQFVWQVSLRQTVTSHPAWPRFLHSGNGHAATAVNPEGIHTALQQDRHLKLTTSFDKSNVMQLLKQHITLLNQNIKTKEIKSTFDQLSIHKLLQAFAAFRPIWAVCGKKQPFIHLNKISLVAETQQNKKQVYPVKTFNQAKFELQVLRCTHYRQITL